MKQLIHYIGTILLFAVLLGCEKPNDSEKILTDGLVNETEATTVSPQITRVFHSDAHERDYNALISGKLSISDLKEKYNLSKILPSGLSDDKLMAIFKGEMNLDEFGFTAKEQEQMIKKSIGVKIGRTKKIENFSNHPYSNNRQLKHTTAQDVLDIWIHYKGNGWGPFTFLEIRVPANKYGGIYEGHYLSQPKKWYRPYYNGYHLNLKVTPEMYPTSYGTRNLSYIWFKMSIAFFHNELYRKLPIMPGQISGNNRVNYAFYAWFKFFWMEYYIVSRITED